MSSADNLFQPSADDADDATMIAAVIRCIASAAEAARSTPK
ncbi:hypothetical protein [Bradyrhizobium elkanii]